MYRSLSFGLLCLLLSATLGHAQGVNYKVHGMFITNFAKYVSWPVSPNNLTIAVMGPQDIVASIAEITNGRKVNNSTIAVKKINSAAEINGTMQIVFLPEIASSQFEAVKQAIGDRPILLVTEKTGLGRQGAMINFVQVGGKMRFELNQSSLESNKLKVSTNLVSLSIKV